MAIFESKKEREKRIETEKFNLEINLKMQLRKLEKTMTESDKKIFTLFNDATAYKNAGNTDAAMNTYRRYLSAKNARKPLEKALFMTENISARVQAGIITGDICAALNKTIESSSFDITAVKELASNDAGLSKMLEEMEVAMDVFNQLSENDINKEAEIWANDITPVNPISPNPVSPQPVAPVAPVQEKDTWLTDINKQINNLKLK